MSRALFEGQESRGGLRDFDFTVTKAYFEEVDISSGDQKRDPVLMLHWEGTTNLDDRPILGGNDFHPTFQVGKDWATIDGGKTITHPNVHKYGTPDGPQLGSWYGRLGTQVLKLTEPFIGTGNDPLEGADKTPLRADMWVGTSWHLDEMQYDFGRMGKSSKLMPTRYLGMKATGAPVTTAGTATVSASSNGAPDDLRSTLEALARSAGSYPEFQAKALKVDGVTKDSALLDEVLDEGRLFTKARG